MSEDPTKIDIRFDPLTQRMTGVTAQGYHPFDVPYMTEIQNNLWTGGCETGLILPVNIKHVVSVYKWEEYNVFHDLDSFTQVTMYDSTDQGGESVVALAEWVNHCRSLGPTLVHCQAGLNRSSLVAATALILGDGLTPQEAIDLLREKRSPAVLCNPAFEQWLLDEKWNPSTN